ncbi:uncharacterized protein GGS22DRAFT_102951 [Annulohypoxylon maeteangense]|uniref:uncharacterized protein n=1 Tax=Annulohypoxylon maeteangense TaxID=1927788 RepID=UPI0020084F8D|nr:uncharacterized protein GGS22DRAFT_102951 [Annulohypoxylon maeteangense]KAI0879895.1 hypothetical protein GGS22DRAFT_102951 [Annulohypoxylon maeteangense]
MKCAVITLVLATFASAQSLSDIPQCALPCIDSARTSSTSCSNSDYACICKNKDAITGAATSCVLQSCGADVATGQVLPAVTSFCISVESGSSGSFSVSASTSSSSATTVMDATSTSASATEITTDNATSGGEAPTSTLAISVTSAASTTVSGINSTASYTSSHSTAVPVAGASSVAGSLVMLVLGFVAAM